MSKPLFVVIGDGGDGSYYPHYTFDVEWIARQEEHAEYPDLGCDGDGFHYDTLTVPDDATYESLGISFPIDTSLDDDEV